MRPDMAKVIVERPRLGSRQKLARGYRKRWGRTPPEDWPRRESIYALKGHTRSFNEHLGPLRRYLRSQVGRPWNLVFSEICANIRVDSAVQSHVRDHVFDFVETHVVERDGQLFALGGFWARALWTSFYVCPRTGLLREFPRVKRVRPARPVERVPVDATREYRRINGLWFAVDLRPLADEPPHAWDPVLRRPVGEVYAALARETYGTEVCAVRLRQLNTRQLRRLGLRNEPRG
jgi:hypothetical protein